MSRKEARRLTLAAPEPTSFGGKALDKMLKDQKDGDQDDEPTNTRKLLDSSVVGKDASHLLN